MSTKIDVIASRLTGLTAALKKAESALEGASGAVSSAKSGLTMEVSAKSGITSQMSKAQKSLTAQSSTIGKLAGLSAQALEEFQSKDKLSGNGVSAIVSRINSLQSSVSNAIKSFVNSVGLGKLAGISGAFLTGGTALVTGLTGGLKDILSKVTTTKSSTGSTTTGSTTKTTNSSTATGSTTKTTSSSTSTGSTTKTTNSSTSTSSTAKKTTTTQKTTTTTTKPATTKLTTIKNGGSCAKNAKNAGITYVNQYKGGSAFKASMWKGVDNPKLDLSFKSNLACGISCNSMAASHFGETVTPGEMLEANYNPKTKYYSASLATDEVKDVLKEHGITMSCAGNYGDTSDAKEQDKAQSMLDSLLLKYQTDPEHNAPPTVGIWNTKDGKTSNHYVTVLGKDKSGNYVIADPGYTGVTTLKLCDTKAQCKRETGTHVSFIKQIFTYTKK